MELYPKSKKGFWGYVNEEGKWVIRPKFDKAFPFNGRYAKVITLGGDELYINKEGEWYRQLPHDWNEPEEEETDEPQLLTIDRFIRLTNGISRSFFRAWERFEED